MQAPLTWGVSSQAHSFPVKLIHLRRPLACHPRSGAKRSGAGSEATLTLRATREAGEAQRSRERSDLDAACHPRSGAKRSGAGSEATLTLRATREAGRSAAEQ